MELWTRKYRPLKIRDILGNQRVANDVKDFLKDWIDDSQNHAAIVLIGKPGTGKTSTVEAAAEELKLELVEFNASDVRKASQVKTIIKAAGKLKVSKPRIILLDEADGFHGREDRGGLAEVLKLLKPDKNGKFKLRNPIIMTANDGRRFKEGKGLKILKYQRIRKPTAKKLLRSIAINEDIDVSDEVLDGLLDTSNGDLRSALNDFQNISSGKKVLTINDLHVLQLRDETVGLFDVIGGILNAETLIDASKLTWGQDPRELLFWLFENLHKYVEDFEELNRTYQILARADMVMAKILETQDWGPLKYYFDLLSICIRGYHKTYFTWKKKLEFPRTWSAMGKVKPKRLKRQSISDKIYIAQRSSLQKNITTIELLSVIFKRDIVLAREFCLRYQFNREEAIFLCGGESFYKKLNLDLPSESESVPKIRKKRKKKKKKPKEERIKAKTLDKWRNL